MFEIVKRNAKSKIWNLGTERTEKVTAIPIEKNQKKENNLESNVYNFGLATKGRKGLTLF